jgi:hypothetical protein
MAGTRAPPPDRAGPALRAVLDRSEGAGGKASLLRDEIVASWERCARAGLRPERFEVPYDADVDDRGRLCWAAGPVLDQVGGDLDGTRAGSCSLISGPGSWPAGRPTTTRQACSTASSSPPASGTGKSRSARTRSARRSQAAARHWWPARNISLTP